MREAYKRCGNGGAFAKEAYQFERDEFVTSTLVASHCAACPAVEMLTGDRLQFDFKNLERRNMESNRRALEI